MQSMMDTSIHRSAPRIAVAVMVLATALSQAQPIELLPNGGGEKINDRQDPAYWGAANSGELVSIREARTGDRAVRLAARPHEWGFSIFVTPNPGSYPPEDILRLEVAPGAV